MKWVFSARLKIERTKISRAVDVFRKTACSMHKVRRRRKYGLNFSCAAFNKVVVHIFCFYYLNAAVKIPYSDTKHYHNKNRFLSDPKADKDGTFLSTYPAKKLSNQKTNISRMWRQLIEWQIDNDIIAKYYLCSALPSPCCGTILRNANVIK